MIPRGALLPALLAAVALTACGNDDIDLVGAPRDGRGAGGGGAVSVLDLRPGICFNIDEAETDTVASVPCTQAHEFEVFFVVDYPGGRDYPSDDALEDFEDETCEGDAFESYVGLDYPSSRYYADAFLPTEETWAEGDREVVCILYDPDDGELTYSARNSRE